MISSTPSVAEALLIDLGIEKPEDIDLEAVAFHCGALVEYKELHGCEANILGVADRAIITVNSQSRIERQRFSIGHELGHWHRDRGKALLHACTSKMLLNGWSPNDPERQANEFASDLLMPLFLFSSHARTIKIDFSGIKEIATIFRTSAMATAIRVVQKGDRPAIVTLVEKNSVVWQVANPIVPKEFWVSGPPAKGTVAHRLLSGSCSDKMLSEDLPSYLWVNSKFGGDYRLVESSWMVTADEVLSLLWWEDEQQIIDYADREEEADDEDQHYSKRKRW